MPNKTYCWPDNPIRCEQPPTTQATWRTKDGFVWNEAVCAGHLIKYRDFMQNKGYKLLEIRNLSESEISV